MPISYSISDIIVSNSPDQPYYAGTFEDTKDPEVEWPHRHNFYSLVWFTAGSGINVIDFEEYKIRANRLFIMQPHQVHNWSYSLGTKGYVLVFDPYFFSDQVEEHRTPYIDLASEQAVFFRSFFKNLIYEFTLDDPLSKKALPASIAYILVLTHRLAARQSKGSLPQSAALTRFSALISENISRPLTVGSYAEGLKLPTEKLNDLCYQKLGLSAKQFILNKKMTEAKRLLFFTDFSVKEIAFQLGFEDSSYFSRIFKQKTRYSPMEFRKKVPV